MFKFIRHAAVASSVLLVLVFQGCRETSVPNGPITDKKIPVKGFSYTAFQADGFQQGSAAGSLQDLSAQTGAEWISICWLAYQSSPTSHDIALNATGINPVTGAAWSTSPTVEDVQAAISDAQTLGKHILLKPQVDLYSGEWRAAIQPGSAWFSAYTAFLLPYAKLAESNGVEMFCIGDEFVLATKFEYTAYWKKLIAAIRAVYSGKLIYAANWSSASDYGDNSSEYLQVGFWKNLDYIGIDAYVPVTSGNTIPSLATGITRLSLFGSALQLLSWRVGRQVIFTEIGIPSVQGALAEPWSSSLVTASGAVASNAVQSYYYSAALEAFANRSWCDGFFWWNWNSQTDSYDSLNYTPRNKPAATILKQRYAI